MSFSSWPPPPLRDRAWRKSGRELGRRAIVGGLRAAVVRSSEERDRVRIRRETARYNEGQSGFDFEGQTFEIKVLENRWRSYYSRELESDWLEYSVSHLLARVGGRATWNARGIQEESRDRDYYTGNRWVNQRTMPGEGTISVARWQLEVTALLAERREDFDLSFGRFFRRGFGFEAGSERVYAGLVARVRDRHSGEVVTSFKVIGRASSADHLEADFFSGLFGQRARGRYDSRQYGALALQAMENALRELGGAFRLANIPSYDARGDRH